MGHTLPEIAETMGRTIPRNGLLFSSENANPHLLKKIADKRNTISRFVDHESVSHEEMKGFSYIEHRENVALALAICDHLKVDRQMALKGMYEAIPDAGVLRIYRIEAFQKQLFLYNAFAANDPDSTLMIWQKIRDEIGFEGLRIVLLNTRQDRLDRAKQLAELSGKKLAGEMDFLVLIGQSTEVVESMALHYGVPKNKIVNIGWTTPARVFESVLGLTEKKSTTVAIGNMGGMGAATVEYFEHRSIKS
jgi:poly-gamma-glutamate synthase PgsB/CapB